MNNEDLVDAGAGLIIAAFVVVPGYLVAQHFDVVQPVAAGLVLFVLGLLMIAVGRNSAGGGAGGDHSGK